MHKSERNCVYDLYLFIEYNTSNILIFITIIMWYFCTNKYPISDNHAGMKAFRWPEIIILYRRKSSRVRIRCNLNLFVAGKSWHIYISAKHVCTIRLHFLHCICMKCIVEGKVTYRLTHVSVSAFRRMSTRVAFMVEEHRKATGAQDEHDRW